MVAFSDLYSLPTLQQVKDEIISIAQSVNLSVTAWIEGDPTERWIEITTRAIHAFESTSTTQAIRGFFLDLATDPGDPGDLSSDQTPREGWLSALGEGWYGTTRRGQTFATTTFEITNDGDSPATFGPGNLTIRSSVAGDDNGFPTYRNTADATVYTNLDGTVTLAPGASVILPIQAEQIGSYGTRSAGEIDTVVTQSYGTLTGSNPSAAIGAERESADDYRARCRSAASVQSPGGPGEAYRRAATTDVNGEPLERYDGSGPVGITRVYVSPDSSTGEVTVYFADDDGPADAIDVSSANANIVGVLIADPVTDEYHNAEPIGVLPDCVTILPTVTDPGTGGPGGAAAVAVNIVVGGTVKIKARSGGLSGAALIAAVRAAIVEALTTAFSEYEIGGVDQVSGAGVIYTEDIERAAGNAYAGLYNMELSTPSASSTALAEGRVAVLKTFATPLSVTGAADNGSGLIRLTVSSTANLATGATIYVSGVAGTTEANGTWVVTVISGTTLDLQGSTFTNAYVASAGVAALWSVTVT